ncbi:hypothetical protein ZWY2020_016690 [Hordeum vulgare]|nr:hypothetical protein ZWY2020_016690 [Hordeum vulgare]
MTVWSADVFHIYGLKNKGKDVIKHLATLEEGSKDYVPSRFLNEKTGTIVIDELIDHIVKSGSFDDDFVRRAVLILIGTVIAPHSRKTVPCHLYSLVEDVDTIKLYNWNVFMLHVCIDGIAKTVKDQHKFKWSVGNLSLIQPTGIDEPLSYEYPLMLNWSEIKAKKRDENSEKQAWPWEGNKLCLIFDDVIGEDHREAKVAKEGTLPEVEAQRDIKTEWRCKWRRFDIQTFLQGHQSRRDESEVWVKSKYAPKYFPEVDSSPLGQRHEEKNNASFTNMPTNEELNDDTSARINGSGIGTPNDPFIVNGNNSHVRSSSSLATNEFPKVTRTPKNGGILILDDMQNDVSPMGSEATIDKLNEDVQDAKRVRKASRWLQFPYEQMDGPKRVKKSLFGNYAVMVSTEYLDAEHIEAANAYINTLIENGKHRKDVVVKIPAPDVDICTAHMLGDIVKKKWLCGAISATTYNYFLIRVINDYCKQIKKHSKVPDRHILSTWVSKWLLDRAAGRVTGRKTKMEILVKRTTTITRVMDEYFSTDKAYFPMNVNGNHWINVLMHNTNKEFQVLDSLGPIDRIIHKTIHTLKAQIAIDIAAANKQVESKFPDVSAWLIMEYEMPKQTDGVSCGLFVLRCIEYLDGQKWTSTFDQDKINESRSKILAELIFSEDNIVEKVKDKLLRLISRD